MSTLGSPLRRNNSTPNIGLAKKKPHENGFPESLARKSISSSRPPKGLTGERTVKSLRLSKALTVPETTSVYEACRLMAARKVVALLLTDSNALLCGILTDTDIAKRVIAREINLEDTPVSKVMTKNPTFVLADTLAVEALQKMVQGRFRHLPVVNNGEVIALLDIAKCLYDAIARLERASEKGKAIAAAVEGSNAFLETLKEKIFRPSLSTIIPEFPKLVRVSPTESVSTTTKKMLEHGASAAIVMVDNKPRGILTSKDILMRVIAQNLPPESTLVETVMTPNPECATVDTPIVDALRTMHDGKVLHLPVLDRDGSIIAVVDALHITHFAIATVGNTANLNNEAASSIIQNFWESTMALTSTIDDGDDESRSGSSLKMTFEVGETGRSTGQPSTRMPNAFSFKLQDKRGRKHRFTCDTLSLVEVMSSIIQRVNDVDPYNMPVILYEDEDHDHIVMASDNDLASAVDHARMAGLKALMLHLDYSEVGRGGRKNSAGSLDYAHSDRWNSAYGAVTAGAAILAVLCLFTYLKRA
ncbi:CBS domain-containing protein CBSCBSPB1-like isoform X2 [Prosopis cineraria]|uniref:CBS domain-containing protein CBSCBSPB1-like isoform X2 n=1 Tax=Prosopis cineraria TaxID=364024 RepID=UPI00240F36CE|nr:CBS domain-containing protein CBSCBSPB1-like isoform X2 [Prosopis cineraria]